jgi:hypothetical protein
LLGVLEAFKKAGAEVEPEGTEIAGHAAVGLQVGLYAVPK